MLKYFFKVSDKISAKFVKNILCRKIYLFCWVQTKYFLKLISVSKLEINTYGKKTILWTIAAGSGVGPHQYIQDIKYYFIMS